VKIHYIQAVPIIILIILAVWHLYSWNYYSGVGDVALQAGVLAVVFAMPLLSMFFRNGEGELAKYLVNMVEPIRPHLIGASCFIIGGLHFIGLVRLESVFFQMGYLILILAYFETASMANGFIASYSGDRATVTTGTLKRLAVKQLGVLGMVFALSMVLLYLALMVVVGFTAAWSVALMAAVMILALAFMTMIRKI
jgi:hypothetical protein